MCCVKILGHTIHSARISYCAFQRSKNIKFLLVNSKICKFKNWQDESIMNFLFNYHLKKRTLANINWHQFFISWAESDVTIIDLKSHLKTIYPHNYIFDEREFRAWKAILHASGCTNVTPWSCDESEVNL